MFNAAVWNIIYSLSFILLFVCRKAGFWGEVWGGAHLPWDRYAPPLRIFAPPLKSHAPPLGEVSMIDQSGNLTFFGCLGFRLRKKVFIRKIETLIAIHLCVKYTFNAMFQKKLCSNCNEGQNWMSCTVRIHWIHMYTTCIHQVVDFGPFKALTVHGIGVVS
jgi:hypothetical protein